MVDSSFYVALENVRQTAVYSIDLYGQRPYIYVVAWKSGGVVMAQVHSHRSRKEERLEARVTPAQKRLIERAAALRGTSVSEFVPMSAQEAATRAIRDSEVLSLRDEARELFIKTILNPPAPNEAARSAAERYKKDLRL